MNPKYRPYAPYGLVIGIVSLLTAASLYFVSREFDLNVQIAVGLGVIGLAVYVLLDPAKVRKAFSGRQARYGGNATVMVLGFLGILVVVNYLVNQYPQRWDLSEDLTNTLTDETIAILDGLEQEVHVVGFYTSRAAASEDRAREILEQYVLASNDKITYEFIDPEAQPGMAQAAGISQDQSLEIIMGDRQEVITVINERELTGAIIRLTSGEIRSVYFLTGHGEYDPDGTDESSYSQAKQALESKNYQVATLNLLAEGEIPEDSDLLVIAGPSVPVTEDEVALIAAYLEQGGALIVMVEPELSVDTPEVDHPLYTYLEESWGVTLGNDIIVDKQGQTGLEAVSFEYGAHPITQRMESVMTIYPTARSLALVEGGVEGVSPIELVTTAPFDTSWAETDLDALAEGTVEPNEEEDIPGPVTIAVVADNFQNGSRLVVFGDTDFASNLAYLVQRNGAMFVNSVDWATNQETLIDLTPRTPTQRFIFPPFPSYVNLVLLVAVFLLPGSVFVAGIAVWVMRRRRT